MHYSIWNALVQDFRISEEQGFDAMRNKLATDIEI